MSNTAHVTNAVDKNGGTEPLPSLPPNSEQPDVSFFDSSLQAEKKLHDSIIALREAKKRNPNFGIVKYSYNGNTYEMEAQGVFYTCDASCKFCKMSYAPKNALCLNK